MRDRFKRHLYWPHKKSHEKAKPKHPHHQGLTRNDIPRIVKLLLDAIIDNIDQDAGGVEIPTAEEAEDESVTQELQNSIGMQCILCTHHTHTHTTLHIDTCSIMTLLPSNYFLTLFIPIYVAMNQIPIWLTSSVMLTSCQRPSGSNHMHGIEPTLQLSPHKSCTLGEDCHPSPKSWSIASRPAAS